jgi:glycolate oxidase FAD binding subunit
LLWLGTVPGTDIRDAVHRAGGHAVLLRADEATRERIAVFEPQDDSRLEITRRVKAAFDPLGLFNPGRMWDGV